MCASDTFAVAVGDIQLSTACTVNAQCRRHYTYTLCIATALI